MFSSPNESNQARHIDLFIAHCGCLKSILLWQPFLQFLQSVFNKGLSMASGNKPWIFLGFILALILGVISATLVCFLLIIDPIIPKFTGTLHYTESEVRNLHQFPIPKVVMMDKVGKGYLFTLKQNPNLSFEIDWSFKLPRSGIPTGSFESFISKDVGHYLFEDKGQIFAISSNMNQKMTVLHPPTKKHFTIQNSQIPEKFYISGHLVRAGNFIMIFGGYSTIPDYDHGFPIFECSSSKTAIWSIKRRIWIKSPYLPEKKCFLGSTGFALNQTHAVLLVIPQDHYIEFAGPGTRCIEAYLFSFETMVWVYMMNCLIDTGYVIGAAEIDKVSLVSTTFFDKKGKL